MQQQIRRLWLLLFFLLPCLISTISLINMADTTATNSATETVNNETDNDTQNEKQPSSAEEGSETTTEVNEGDEQQAQEQQQPVVNCDVWTEDLAKVRTRNVH
jgi:hypothetical protein